MAFNIYAHIIDHAHYLIDNLVTRDKKLVHFNTSVDASYFIRNGYVTQEDIDEIMVNILKDISQKEIVVREKNGTYLNQTGMKIQKYRTRKIVFDNLLAAYHSKHFDASKSVMPHLHFLLGEDARVGKDFIYLKQALKEEAQRYGIKFNFMEKRQEIGISRKQLQNIKRLSWHFNQGDLAKIKVYLSKPNHLETILDTLVKHYEHTQNLSFFMKTLLIVNKRLQELNIDYEYKGTNLKESVFFLLSREQREKIDVLKSGYKIKLDLNQVLDRELLKYAHDFKSEVVDIVTDVFGLEEIKKGQFDYAKNVVVEPSKKEHNTFRNLVIYDIRKALANASDEKEWKNLLLEMGYEKVAVKTQKNSYGKRERVGLNVVTQKKTNMTVYFSELKLERSRIIAIMMHNAKKKKKKIVLKSRIEDYSKIVCSIHIDYKKYEYRVKVLLKLYSSDVAKAVPIDNLAKRYNVYRSNMYNITTLENEDVTIVDSGKELTLEKSVEVPDKNAISDMLDLAVLKGWDLKCMEVTGSNVFIQETQKQIEQRINAQIQKSKVKHRRR